MRRVLAIAVGIAVLPFLMGASSITLVVTPNPGGMPGVISGNGMYTVDPADGTFDHVQFGVTLKGSNPPQVTQRKATAMNGSWSCMLTVAPSTYNPSEVDLYATKIINMKSVTMIVVNGMNTNDQVVR